jgi:hypothetical protein
MEQNKIEISLPETLTNYDIYRLFTDDYKDFIEVQKEELFNNKIEALSKINKLKKDNTFYFIGSYKQENNKVLIKYRIEEKNPINDLEYGKMKFKEFLKAKYKELVQSRAIELAKKEIEKTINSQVDNVDIV